MERTNSQWTDTGHGHSTNRQGWVLGNQPPGGANVWPHCAARSPGTPNLVASHGHLPLMDQCLKEKTWAFQPHQSIHLLFIMKSVWIGFLLLEIRVLTEHTAFPSPTESSALTEDQTSGCLGRGETGPEALTGCPGPWGAQAAVPVLVGTHSTAVSCLALGEPPRWVCQGPTAQAGGVGTVGGRAALVF